MSLYFTTSRPLERPWDFAIANTYSSDDDGLRLWKEDGMAGKSLGRGQMHVLVCFQGQNGLGKHLAYLMGGLHMSVAQ